MKICFRVPVIDLFGWHGWDHTANEPFDFAVDSCDLPFRKERLDGHVSVTVEVACKNARIKVWRVHLVAFAVDADLSGA